MTFSNDLVTLPGKPVLSTGATRSQFLVHIQRKSFRSPAAKHLKLAWSPGSTYIHFEVQMLTKGIWLDLSFFEFHRL